MSMTSDVLYTIVCDIDGCTAASDPEPDLVELRELLAEGGWTYTSRYDYCPEHFDDALLSELS